MKKEIYKPIFIIGCPRSGTSILHTILASHPHLAWFSSYTNWFPRIPPLAVFSKMFDIPSLWRFFSVREGERFLPLPIESWNIWRYCDPEFPLSMPLKKRPRALTKNDVTEIAVRRIRRTISRHLAWQKKRRFITKYTNYPRMAYLTEVLPDSIFINVLRDGRAVAYSIMNMMSNRNWFPTPDRRLWQRNWPEEWVRFYHDCGRLPIVFAANMWQYFTKEILQESSRMDRSRYFELRYEELVSAPSKTIEKIAEFCELEWNAAFRDKLRSFHLENMNFKWKRNLSSRQKELLESSLRGSLEPLNYA